REDAREEYAPAAGGGPSVVGRAAEPLRHAATALLVEPPLLRGRGRLRRTPLPAHRRRLAQLLEDSLGRELAVTQLRALVLRDRAHDRSELREHAAPLGRREPGRLLDVEQRLGARRALLRVLAARPTGPREPESDLRPNRLGIHGGHSPGRG